MNTGGSFRPRSAALERLRAEPHRFTFDAVVRNTRDIAELMQKSGSEATAIIMNRIRESIAEARASTDP